MQVQEVHFEAVEEHRQRQQRDRALRAVQVAQRFASTLCLREVRTRLIPSASAPAWSTSNTITYVEQHLGDLSTIDGVLSMKGLSFHEIAHILFTPRAGSELVEWVMEERMKNAFNALEDQRIETLMVGRFGDPVVPWLTAAVAQHLLEDVARLHRVFPLVWGRKYLPQEVRALVRDVYQDSANVAQLRAVIDEYRLLVFPGDTERAKELISRYSELVAELPEAPESNCSSRSPEQYGPDPKSRPAKQQAQKQAQKNARNRDDQDPEESPDESDEERFDFGEEEPPYSPEESDSDNTDGLGNDNGEDSKEDSAEGEGAGEGEGADLSEGEDDSYDSEGTDGAGVAAAKDAPLDRDLKEKAIATLEAVLDAVKDRMDDTLRKDLANIAGDVELETTKAGVPPIARSASVNVKKEVMRASRSFETELERLRAKFEPDWERLTKHGKVNASRFMRGYDIDEVFDKWQPGREDAVDIEAVILLDTSGSMGGNRIEEAAQAMWGLKRALDRVQASTTVVSFSSQAELVYSSSETVGMTVRQPRTWGGTDPKDALAYAQRILAESERAIRILFVVTDGAWGLSSDVSEEAIETMRKGGVLTALAYIGGAFDSYEYEGLSSVAHRCEVACHITAPRDLLFLGRQLVRLAIARQLTFN